jgi:hypothetical protein
MQNDSSAIARVLKFYDTATSPQKIIHKFTWNPLPQSGQQKKKSVLDILVGPLNLYGDSVGA